MAFNLASLDVSAFSRDVFNVPEVNSLNWILISIVKFWDAGEKYYTQFAILPPLNYKGQI